MLDISSGGVEILAGLSDAGSSEVALVRSQCLLRKIGISEKALNR